MKAKNIFGYVIIVVVKTGLIVRIYKAMNSLATLNNRVLRETYTLKGLFIQDFLMTERVLGGINKA